MRGERERERERERARESNRSLWMSVRSKQTRISGGDFNVYDIYIYIYRYIVIPQTKIPGTD